MHTPHRKILLGAFCGLCGSVSSLSVSGQSKKLVTLDDLMRLRAIVDVRIAPKGDRIAYVVSTPSLTRNQHEAALYLVPSSGGAPRRLAETTRILNTPMPAPRLRWAPDGARLAFLGLTAGRPQVCAVDVATGDTRALTDAPEGATGFEWSPDGRSVAYLMRDPVAPDDKRREQEMSLVIHAGAPERATRLVIQPIGDTAAARVLTPPSYYVQSLSFSPDGKEIAFDAAPGGGFMSQYMTRIYTVPSAGGTPRAVVDRPGMNSTPQYSPDGRRLAFITSSEKVSLMAPRSLAVVDLEQASAMNIRALPLDDAWVSDATWTPDGKSLYVLTTDGTFGRDEHMFEQAIVRVSIETGKAERVDRGAAANYSLTISRDGTRLAHRAVEARTMGDVFVTDVASGRAKKITDVNPELRDLALGELKAISWRSFDGMQIWGLLLTPPCGGSFPPCGQKRPLLVYCHGGPNGSITYGLFPQFMHIVPQVDYYPVEAMASAGFAILFPMPRGGAGYGEAGQRSIVNAWGDADYKDIMTGVDDLVAKGLADPDRLGVMGASYGGYMTDWIVTQTGRFKAASAGASISDLADEYFLSDAGEIMAEYFKRPWEARESYLAHSPLTFADRVTTPLLIQHGERDMRVPVAHAWKFYRALKAMGKTVELDIHPRGGHVFYEPAQEREAMKRNLEWFEKWIP
jgi:dipeptidyl aminopeptidase/acylaminoacyl peptidase